MIRPLVLAATLALVPLMGAAQDRAATLADIRAQISQLGAELSDLRGELVSTGAIARPGGSSVLERLESLELELMRLTGRTEEIEMKVNRVVADGTNRLDDLEFRVVELEGGDPSAVGQAQPAGNSGGQTAAPAAPAAAQPVKNEKADLDRAREVLGQGDFRTAENLFASIAETYPSGEITGEALYLRGQALEGLGDVPGAANLYLESFSGYPTGRFAAPALSRLGRALVQLGQTHEGCLTMGEVALRYPDHPVVAETEAERQVFGCQ